MKTLILLLLASTASDARYTHQNMLTGRELNPIARPFMKSAGTQVLFFSADDVITISLARLLKHHHHPRLGEAIILSEIAGHTAGAAYDATHPVRREK